MYATETLFVSKLVTALGKGPPPKDDGLRCDID